jgi:hypothetical protein
MWMGPGDPMESTGAMTTSMDLGGRFLRQEYKGDPGEGPFPNFEGRGFWGYNTAQSRFEGFWIDSASTLMQFESGQVDESGKIWTMTGEMPDPQGKGSITKRSVITVQDDDHHKIEMFFEKGGQASKGMEISYTRSA